MKKFLLAISLLAVLASACRNPQPAPPMAPPLPDMSPEVLEDRLLGALVGSAIGDAMGAPTEMWPRFRIQAEFGHVDSLDHQVRGPSPEGVWGYNLPAGGTTDDTRWKALLIDFIAGTQENPQPRPDSLSAAALAQLLLDRYQLGIREMQEAPSPDADQLEDGLQRVLWLKEWASVAEAYQSGDIDAYGLALNKFYGGEMVCGGMLFAPVIGMAYPGAPEYAYEQAFNLNIYDIGYGRDIGALTASMVSVAMVPGADGKDLREVLREVDPRGYFRSRLVGRSSYELFRRALDIAEMARTTDPEQPLEQLAVRLAMPIDSLEMRQRYVQWAVAYEALDQQLFRMAFHPGELWLIMWTAMLVCDYDFRQTLAFIINYGRDNDTSGAVAGAILGAMYGAEALPADLVEPTLEANLELGLDLREMAGRMVKALLATPEV